MTPAEKLSAKQPWRKPGRNLNKRQSIWRCVIRERREKLRLSLRVIAEHLGMSIAGLHCIEHGSDPQLTTASKLAEFFGVTIAELWPERNGK